MPNQLSPALLAEFYGQDSSDPFLMLLELSHSSFSTIYLANDVKEVVSNGDTYSPFPFSFVLPTDDGESNRVVKLNISNIGLDLID